MEADQVLTAATPGDPATIAALELRSLLGDLGGSQIYARHVDPLLAGAVHPLAEYAERRHRRPADALVHHTWGGDPAVRAFLADRPEPLVLCHHGSPPAAPTRPWDAATAGRFAAGPGHLRALRPRVALALASCPATAHELEVAGYDTVEAVPVVDTARLVAVTPDPGTTHHFEELATGPVVLFAGELLPHQRAELLVATAHVLTTYHDPDIQFVLAGGPAVPTYRDSLVTFVERLNLLHLWIAGAVPPAQLAALYRAADVFVTMSEYEGLALPLLQAMAFDVPIVGRQQAGVSDTVGPVGLLLPADAGPELAAEAVLELLSSTDRRRSQAAAGRGRLAALQPGTHAPAPAAELLRRIAGVCAR